MAEWLAVDDDLPIYHAHKLQQIDSYPDEVIAALPESDSAQKEFGRLLLTHLTVHHGQRYSTDGHNLSTRDGRLQWPLPATDLQSCSLWIQEDICLLQALNDEYVLTAAVSARQATGDYLRKSAKRSARSMILCPAMAIPARQNKQVTPQTQQG